MWEFNDAISIEYRKDYVYHVAFDDSTEADVDFAQYLDAGPVFEPLRNLTFFKLARIEGGTIAWPNGADVAPETLYEKTQRAGEQLDRTG